MVELPVGADGARSRVRRQLLPDARRIDTPAICRRLAIFRSRLLRVTARGFFRLCGAVGPLRRAVFSG